MLTSALRNNGSEEPVGNPKSGQLPGLDRKSKSRQIQYAREREEKKINNNTNPQTNYTVPKRKKESRAC